MEIKERAFKGNSISVKKSKTILEFTQIMEQLILSGLSIKDSLEIISEVEDNSLAEEILVNINKGKTFAETICDMYDLFPVVYRGIIRIGDRIGSVEKIFPRLKLYLENQKKIKDKVINALLYPTTVLATTIMGAFLLSWFVFPKLKIMFNDFGGVAGKQLQEKVDNLKAMLMVFSCLFSLLLIISFILFKLCKKNSEIRKMVDKMVLRIPYISNFIISLETLNFSFSMETLTAGGVTIENAMKESLSVVSNTEYKRSIQNVVTDIIDGLSLYKAFSTYDIFPKYLTKWMKVGEKSGKTEQVFTQIRIYYQNEIELKTSKIMSLIEPFLIILIGLFLLLFVITIIVPIFSFYGTLI